MVNGPRPTALQTAAAAAAGRAHMSSTPSATAGLTPSRSPLLLQRQTTSIYSACTSTGTPILVYGKHATPLAGAWSSEPWDAAFPAQPLSAELEERRGADIEDEHDRDDDAMMERAETAIPVAAADDDDEVTLGDGRHHSTTDDASSVADTAAFSDHHHHHHHHHNSVMTYRAAPPASMDPSALGGGDEDALAIPSTPTAARGPMSTLTSASTMRQQQQSQSQHRTHVARKYRFDPYSAAGCHEVYRCDCDACLDGFALGRDTLVAGSTELHSFEFGFEPAEASYLSSVYTAPPQQQQQQHAGMMMMLDERYPSDDYFTADYDDGCSTATYSHQAAAPHHHHHHQLQPRNSVIAGGRVPSDDVSTLGAWHAAVAEDMVVEDVPAEGASLFMPPPPPPKITRGVMAESAGPGLDVDAAFYHIAARWYSKVARVQANFVADSDFCPAPREDMPFDLWVQDAGKWWLRHFEHRQIKTSASSGLLRTGGGAAAASSSVPGMPALAVRSGAGFETHANVAETYAAHKHALRSGPRKQRGTSGLTAQMLEGLGVPPAAAAPSAAIPTPRSRRLQDLPW